MRAFSALITLLGIVVPFFSFAEDGPIIKPGPDDISGYAKGEALIANSEEKALQQLEKLLKKYKGNYQEPDLLYRQAELYMRRAKAGRFFDLYRFDKKVASIVPPKVAQASAKSSVAKAVSIYGDILNRFPKYSEMDAVLFNKAFAHAQLAEYTLSAKLYTRLLADFKTSPLIPETLVALGEILYDEQQFDEALMYFDQVQKFPNFRMFPFSVYKSSWCLYNMRKTKEAMNRLEELLGLQPFLNAQAQKSKYDLRAEAIRDMTIFYGDIFQADEAVPYFKKHLSPEEIGPALIQLTKIYEGHSRQKELIVILNAFTKEYPLDPKHIEALQLLSEAHEELKSRDKSIAAIEKMHELCKSESAWTRMNKDQASLDACSKTVPDYTLEVAKRWWELWNKNKANKEISLATQKIFQFHLNSEKGKSDLQNRYAYAELLFQNELFLDASIQYEEVGRNIENKLISHDAIYAAIVCIDKLIEKDPKLKPRLLGLSEFYVEKNPQGKYFADLQLKRAQLLIDLDNRLKAEEIVKNILSIKGKDLTPVLKKTAEDLYLSLLFQRKEYFMVKEKSFAAIKQENEPKRKDRLVKLYKESQLLLIDEVEKSGKEIDAANSYLSFYTEHKGSEGSLESLWKAISLYFSNGREYEGAEAARIYSLESKDKEKVTKALTQSLKAYLDVGQLKKAALVQEDLLKSETDSAKAFDEKWLMAELFEIDNAKESSEKIFFDLYKEAKKDKKSILIEKLLRFYGGDDKNPHLKQIKTDIENLKLEPFFTNYKLEELRSQMRKSSFAAAFDSARKIMSSEGTMDQKTEARLAQAFILELEHNSQSVKSSVDRLPTVLALKTEKLDKASSSYSQALKMSENPKWQVQSLEGLKRIYNNYVSSISNMVVTSELSDADLQALKGELKNLTDPIAEKEFEVSQKLQKLAGVVDTQTSSTGFENLGFNQTYLHAVGMPKIEEMRTFVPSWPDPKRWLSISEIPSNTCSDSTLKSTLPFATLGENINKCIKAGKWQKVDEAALSLMIKEPNSPWGAFYSAFSARAQNQLARAEWFFNLAVEKEKKSSLLYFERAKLNMILERPILAREDFLQSNKLDLLVMEQKLFRGLLSYQQGKFAESVDDLNMVLTSGLPVAENIIIALTECYSKLSNNQQAVSLVESTLRKKPSMILWLQGARLYESQIKDLPKAKQAYTEALKFAVLDTQKEWIRGKLKYLEGQKK